MKKHFFFLLAGLLIFPLLSYLVQREVSYFQRIIGPDGKISLVQYVAAKKLSWQKEGIKVSWDTRTRRTPFILSGNLAKVEEKDELGAQIGTVLGFLKENKDLYLLKEPIQELKPVRSKKDGIASYLLFQQMYGELPVYGGELIARIRPDGTLDNISGHYLPDILLDTQAVVDLNQAKAIMEADLNQTLVDPILAELLVLDLGLLQEEENLLGEYRLAWQIDANFWIYFIDAKTGEIIYKYLNLHDAQDRETYLAKDQKPVTCSDLKGTLWANEGGRIAGLPDNSNAEDSHNHAAKVYNYFKNTFGLDSFDGQGSKMVSSVDVPHRDWVCNAAWSSTCKIAYFGKGSESSLGTGCPFRHFSAALDTVGHEWTHGVVLAQKSIRYIGQSGAIQETLADFFGEMIEGRLTWQHGEDLSLTDPPRPVRDMADPKKSYNPQPDHMNQVRSNEVHYLCGITNKASYLLAIGGTHYGISVEGITPEKVAELYYRTFSYHLTYDCDFNCFREKLLLACGELSWWCGESQKNSIMNAFAAVGVGLPASGPTSSPGVSLTPTATGTPGPSPTSGLSPTPTPLPTPIPEENVLYFKVRFDIVSLTGQPEGFLFTLKALGTDFSKNVIVPKSGEEVAVSLAGLEEGQTYDLVLCSHGFLSAKRTLTINSGRNPAEGSLDFGFLKIGDLNKDNQINALDWSWMKLNYGSSGEN